MVQQSHYRPDPPGRGGPENAQRRAAQESVDDGRPRERADRDRMVTVENRVEEGRIEGAKREGGGEPRALTDRLGRRGANITDRTDKCLVLGGHG